MKISIIIEDFRLACRCMKSAEAYGNANSTLSLYPRERTI